MMVLEQLFTAGTVTELFMRRLRNRYDDLLSKKDQNLAEEGRALGHLSIRYFKHVPEWGPEAKCHIKCTIVDGQVVVLGSGNMDRASWYTSQELGIAIEDKSLAVQVADQIDTVLEGRVETWYESK